MREQYFTKEVGGERRSEFVFLPELTVINAAWMIAAHPLGPAVEVKPAPCLMTGQIGITDKPEVGLEAECGECVTEPCDAGREAPNARVRVGSFE
jgi:hypothetical protein